MGSADPSVASMAKAGIHDTISPLFYFSRADLNCVLVPLRMAAL
jgi:hypothetical protein